MPGPHGMASVIAKGGWALASYVTNCYIFSCKKPIAIGDLVFYPGGEITKWHQDNYETYYTSVSHSYLTKEGFYLCEKCGDSKVKYHAKSPKNKVVVAKEPNKKVYITSFSYKKGGDGLVQAGFKLYDIRLKIRNPWRDPELRKKTGLDADVQAFIKACPKTDVVLWDLLTHYIVGNTKIAIGCAGGQHRSVAIAEFLAERVKEYAYEPVVVHRDLKAGVNEE